MNVLIADDDPHVRSAVRLLLEDEPGISIVAEGAETEAELDSLMAIGCDQVQGYSIAFPMPQDKALEWLTARMPKKAKLRVLQGSLT